MPAAGKDGAGKTNVMLRLSVLAPPKGVVHSLQDKDSGPVNVCLSTGQTLDFEIKTAASPAAEPSPTPKPEPLIAYLNEGNLWVVKSDGSQKRVLAQSPEGEVIGDFIWSIDGTRIYFSIGLQLFEVVVESGNVANAGGLKTPIGVTLDRLELGRDGKTIVVHTIDADSAPRIFSLIPDSNSSRELTVDEYAALVAFRTPVIRTIGDISVSPDGNRILFKSAVGTGEELFVAESENGSRIQITNLSGLNGFED